MKKFLSKFWYNLKLEHRIYVSDIHIKSLQDVIESYEIFTGVPGWKLHHKDKIQHIGKELLEARDKHIDLLNEARTAQAETNKVRKELEQAKKEIEHLNKQLKVVIKTAKETYLEFLKDQIKQLSKD